MIQPIIRQAVAADLPEIHFLHSQDGSAGHGAVSLEEATRTFHRMLLYPDYRLYVALARGRVVGSFALLIMDSISRPDSPSAVIEEMVVARDMRDQGIGRAMITVAGQLCRDKGCRRMTLSVHREGEAAQRFSRSLGFEHQGYSFSLPLQPRQAVFDPHDPICLISRVGGMQEECGSLC